LAFLKWLTVCAVSPFTYYLTRLQVDQILFARIVREQRSQIHELLSGAKRQLTPSVTLVCGIDGTSRGATYVSPVIGDCGQETYPENACHLLLPTGLFKK
jgi:hypothetical protein